MVKSGAFDFFQITFYQVVLDKNGKKQSKPPAESVVLILCNFFRGRCSDTQELQEDIFQNKQQGEHIHHGVDFFSPAANQIQHYIRDHAEGDPLRNAVKQGHC